MIESDFLIWNECITERECCSCYRIIKKKSKVFISLKDSKLTYQYMVKWIQISFAICLSVPTKYQEI